MLALSFMSTGAGSVLPEVSHFEYVPVAQLACLSLVKL